MAIFVYAENINGVYKKAAFEAVAYAKAIADQAGDTVTAISINPTDSSDLLYKYGASKVINVKDEGLKSFSAKAYADAVNQLAEGNIIVFPHTTDASSIAPMLAIQKDSSLITNVIAAPESLSPFQVKRKAFSGKGYMHVIILTHISIPNWDAFFMIILNLHQFYIPFLLFFTINIELVI